MPVAMNLLHGAAYCPGIGPWDSMLQALLCIQNPFQSAEIEEFLQ